jgi:hypothetical protein
VFRFEPDYRWQLARSGIVDAPGLASRDELDGDRLARDGTVVSQDVHGLAALVDERTARAVAESGAMRLVARVVGNDPRDDEDDARAPCKPELVARRGLDNESRKRRQGQLARA